MGPAYSCEVENRLSIMSPNNTFIKSVKGDHKNGHTNDDVKALCINGKNTSYFPKGLEKLFKNLRRIRIAHGQLKEISQADFQPFPWLIELTLNGNDIRVLENGIFEYNLNLAYINIAENKIVHIGNSVFDHLTKLTKLILTLNNCTKKASINDNMGIKEMIGRAKKSCISSEFLELENNLMELEDEHRFVKRENFQNFTEKVKEFQQELQNSSFSDLMTLNDRFGDLFEHKTKSFWIVKDKVEYSERSINELTRKLDNQNRNWMAEVNTKWIQIIVTISAFVQIIISVVILIVIFYKK